MRRVDKVFRYKKEGNETLDVSKIEHGTTVWIELGGVRVAHIFDKKEHVFCTPEEYRGVKKARGCKQNQKVHHRTLSFVRDLR